MSKIYAKAWCGVDMSWMEIPPIQPLSGSGRAITTGSYFALRWSSITPVDDTG